MPRGGLREELDDLRLQKPRKKGEAHSQGQSRTVKDSAEELLWDCSRLQAADASQLAASPLSLSPGKVEASDSSISSMHHLLLPARRAPRRTPYSVHNQRDWTHSFL